jgi:hypothetical protein
MRGTHRHAAYMGVAQQTPSADRPAVPAERHGMHAMGILLIAFFFDRHMLLLYEDLVPDFHGRLLVRFPIA